MKLTEVKETDKYVEYKLDLLENEEKELKKICNEHNITVQEFVTLCLIYMRDNPEQVFSFIKKHRTDKCKAGTIGKPLFKYEDEVGFYITPYKSDKEIFCKGKVYIIDSYGTFEQNEEPSYDIMVENFNNTGEACLVKHIRESSLYTMKFEEL